MSLSDVVDPDFVVVEENTSKECRQDVAIVDLEETDLDKDDLVFKEEESESSCEIVPLKENIPEVGNDLEPKPISRSSTGGEEGLLKTDNKSLDTDVCCEDQDKPKCAVADRLNSYGDENEDATRRLINPIELEYHKPIKTVREISPVPEEVESPNPDVSIQTYPSMSYDMSYETNQLIGSNFAPFHEVVWDPQVNKPEAEQDPQKPAELAPYSEVSVPDRYRHMIQRPPVSVPWHQVPYPSEVGPPSIPPPPPPRTSTINQDYKPKFGAMEIEPGAREVSDMADDKRILFDYLPKLRFSYRINPEEPSLLSYVDEIFKRPEDLDENMDMMTYYRKYFTIMEEDNNYSKSYYMDDSRKFAQNIAAGFNVEACYGVFCLGALMSASYSSTSTVRTARYEEADIIEKYIAFGKRDFKECPETFLTPGFIRTVGAYSDPGELEERLGTFYPWKMKLGGCIKKSFVLEVSEDDNEANVTAELKTQFGPKVMGLNTGSAGCSTKYTKRAINKKANVKIEMRTKGGKPELWLGESLKTCSSTSDGSDSESESTRQKWAKSFDNTNLYPISYELKPVWELIKKIDPVKGKRYEEYLKEKWENNVTEMNQAKFLKSKRISSLINVKDILALCKKYSAECEEDEIKANNKYQTFSFIPCFSKRYQHWKTAVQNGKEEFSKLIAAMKDPNTTVKLFREMVEERSVHYRIHAIENKGPYWGPVYRKHAEKLVEVIDLVDEGKARRKLLIES